MDALQPSPNIDVIHIGDRRTAPVNLSSQVRRAVEQYFSQMDGHDTSGLHAMVMSEVEKPLLEAVLEHTGHNQTKAAKTLGLSRSTLRKKMAQYAIS